MRSTRSNQLGVSKKSSEELNWNSGIPLETVLKIAASFKSSKKMRQSELEKDFLPISSFVEDPGRTISKSQSSKRNLVRKEENVMKKVEGKARIAKDLLMAKKAGLSKVDDFDLVEMLIWVTKMMSSLGKSNILVDYVESNGFIHTDEIMLPPCASENLVIIEKKENIVQYTDRFLREKWGFRREQVEGDGNCFFRAVSSCVFGTEEHHREVRFWIFRVLVQFPSYFSKLVEFGGTLDSYNKFLGRVSSDGNWAGEPEKLATQMLFRTDFRVVFPKSAYGKWSRTSSGPPFEMDSQKQQFVFQGVGSICLWQTRNHFDAVIPEEVLSPFKLDISPSQYMAHNFFLLKQVSQKSFPLLSNLAETCLLVVEKKKLTAEKIQEKDEVLKSVTKFDDMYWGKKNWLVWEELVRGLESNLAERTKQSASIKEVVRSKGAFSNRVTVKDFVIITQFRDLVQVVADSLSTSLLKNRKDCMVIVSTKLRKLMDAQLNFVDILPVESDWIGSFDVIKNWSLIMKEVEKWIFDSDCQETSMLEDGEVEVREALRKVREEEDVLLQRKRAREDEAGRLKNSVVSIKVAPAKKKRVGSNTSLKIMNPGLVASRVVEEESLLVLDDSEDEEEFDDEEELGADSERCSVVEKKLLDGWNNSFCSSSGRSQSQPLDYSSVQRRRFESKFVENVFPISSFSSASSAANSSLSYSSALTAANSASSSSLASSASSWPSLLKVSSEPLYDKQFVTQDFSKSVWGDGSAGVMNQSSQFAPMEQPKLASGGQGFYASAGLEDQVYIIGD